MSRPTTYTSDISACPSQAKPKAETTHAGVITLARLLARLVVAEQHVEAHDDGCSRT